MTRLHVSYLGEHTDTSLCCCCWASCLHWLVLYINCIVHAAQHIIHVVELSWSYNWQIVVCHAWSYEINDLVSDLEIFSLSLMLDDEISPLRVKVTSLEQTHNAELDRLRKEYKKFYSSIINPTKVAKKLRKLLLNNDRYLSAVLTHSGRHAKI